MVWGKLKFSFIFSGEIPSDKRWILIFLLSFDMQYLSRDHMQDIYT